MQSQVNKIANYQYNFEREVFRINCMLHLDSQCLSLCVCSAIFYPIDSITFFILNRILSFEKIRAFVKENLPSPN